MEENKENTENENLKDKAEHLKDTVGEKAEEFAKTAKDKAESFAGKTIDGDQQHPLRWLGCCWTWHSRIY